MHPHSEHLIRNWGHYSFKSRETFFFSFHNMTSLTRESLTDLRTERMLFTFNLSCINSFIIPCRRSFSLLRVPLWSYLFFQLKHVYWCDNIPPILPNNRFYNVGKHAHTHAVVKTEQLQVLVPNGNHVKSQR